MTHFSLTAGDVQAELFKPGGKWYETFELDMSDFYNEMSAPEAVRKAWEKVGRKLHAGWSLVVFEPYHKNAYPIMLVGDED